MEDDECRAEIEDLHRFFEAWLGGRGDDEAFRRCEQALAPGFELIGPEANVRTREEVLNGLREAHGKHAESGFRIWIENYRGRPLSPRLQLATYEEWQEIGGEKRGRLSSALLRACLGAPYGVEWLHVHEVWLKS